MPASPDDYWRDGIAMTCVDLIDRDRVFDAVRLAKTGPEFNAAIWATSRLREIADEAADAAYLSRRR